MGPNTKRATFLILHNDDAGARQDEACNEPGSPVTSLAAGILHGEEGHDHPDVPLLAMCQVVLVPGLAFLALVFCRLSFQS